MASTVFFIIPLLFTEQKVLAIFVTHGFPLLLRMPC